MATCNDCVHHDICSLWSTTDLIQDEAQKYCNGNFKNKADVVEAEHGYWKEVNQIGRGSRHIQYTTKQCSVCGYWNGRKKTNYCPECGAKMDGERKCGND